MASECQILSFSLANDLRILTQVSAIKEVFPPYFPVEPRIGKQKIKRGSHGCNDRTEQIERSFAGSGS
jgi:hypothetical protein